MKGNRAVTGKILFHFYFIGVYIEVKSIDIVARINYEKEGTR
ncbi:hypothetical protein [Clostridium beijerinckii]|nr:hypothetical protein [Clostridium beijerinckii]NOW33421.1 hypothetical protein [Clostridium beijerinckii]NOW83085.1 hypothetical protein [Clostridium beijerinckii]